MNFRQELTAYAAGDRTADQLPVIAMAGLEEGLDTPSLRILAGMDKSDNPFEIEKYFKQMLDELHIELADKRQTALDYALVIVDQILTGDEDVITGTHNIFTVALAKYPFEKETRRYVYDSIGLEKIYGLLDTYSDISEADIPWHKKKTNQELMDEVRVELLVELKKWAQVARRNKDKI
jgi:hypothetical protein